MRQKSIAVFTSSRADYGHLYWPLRALSARPELDLQLVAMGPHLSPEFGHTVDAIEADGLPVAHRVECLLSSDTDIGMAKTIGIATQSLADLLGRVRPDLILVIADRFEMLAPANVALALRIPIIHIEGGEASEGAIDQAVRNALTMMSHVHLTPTDLSRRRVIAMGEEPWRVHRVGAPSLDHLLKASLLGREELEAELGLALDRPPIVIGYHPVTLQRDTTDGADDVYRALAEIPDPLVFCFPNADAGSRALIARAREFCDDREQAHLLVNLAPRVYWSLLAQSALLLGNSSSGIMEAPSLRIPSVNIGSRQLGRERAVSVIDVPPTREAILAGVRRAQSRSFRDGLEGMENPYGDGRSSERIADIVASLELGDRLLRKPVRSVDR